MSDFSQRTKAQLPAVQNSSTTDVSNNANNHYKQIILGYLQEFEALSLTAAFQCGKCSTSKNMLPTVEDRDC
jgi:hypothetical protein